MFGILCFLVILFHGSHAQGACFPDHVGKVLLDLNYTLYWEASHNCDSTTYTVYIRVEDEYRYFYNTENTSLDVSFLPACELFLFDVRAFSGNYMSNPVVLLEYVPAPSEADLTIAQFNATHEDDAVLLQWVVTEKFAHCARGFRVVIRDTLEDPRDIYTQDNYISIDGLAPCAEYEFEVMAIYNIQAEGPIALINYQYPPATLSMPELASVEAADTYVNTSWSVSPYSVNRCPITSFGLVGPYFTQTYPVQDSPERPTINISMTNLKPDSMYFLRAYVVNSAGTSKPFPLAVHTLPAATN